MKTDLSLQKIAILLVVFLLAACNTPPTADGSPLVLVPAGEFTMGSDLLVNEGPIHKVTLNAFWIDQFEITNEYYKKCVTAGACSAPAKGSTARHPDGYYGNAIFDHYPVTYVGWDEANTYCQWAGKRLPSEAEWEKAARGTDGRRFPWGNTFDEKRANSALRLELVTTAAGTYPEGASPYGAQDMAGNVWEWVADWYDENYYATSPAANPTGPATGSLKILRGGGYGGYDAAQRTSMRREITKDERTSYIGFRCVYSAP